MSEFVCDHCGKIDKGDVELYNINLRKQNFDITPIDPTCKICGSRVTIRGGCQGGHIIVLSGTCGSGKSTIAIELAKNHGFFAMDGDCVLQSVRHKPNMAKVQFNSQEAMDEIAYEIDCIRPFSDKIVFAQVVLPEDMENYIRIFKERGLCYHFVLLKPDYENALARCQVRTCHKSVTPEYWVSYFYDKTCFSDDMHVIDNTSLTVEETAPKDFRMCQCLCPVSALLLRDPFP